MQPTHRIPRCSTLFTMAEQAKRAREYQEAQAVKRAAKRIHAEKWRKLKEEASQ